MKTSLFVLALAGVAVMSLAMVAYALGGIPGLAQRHRLEGVFAPAYDASGEHLFFIHRRTRGWSFGPGWEHFTPPARARASRDVFSLRRLDLATGGIDELATWPRSPLVGRTISTYRNRIFTPISARIRVRDGEVEYRVRMSIPTQPRSELHHLSGTWKPGTEATVGWEQGHAEVSGYGETPLAGRWEAMAVSGPERSGFAPGPVMIQSARRSCETLQASPGLTGAHETGLRARLFDLPGDGLRERPLRSQAPREARSDSRF